ncbi:hypothetical protein CK556_01640 [Mesoplasma chauliocola]|uniref:Uncharacterized protein n=1 Tax=Mesoplasma chauliocola TaxID=216427 RepID=A0A249SN38_9MOLU|nr:hypothetical protein [Mesoplasma chauliocola]ASZ09058.1 hypothetical protein CK556_01640 [Mesoplasma chauliocola]
MNSNIKLVKKVKMSEKEINFRDTKIQKFVIKDILEMITKAGYDKNNLYFSPEEGVNRDNYAFLMFTKKWITSIIKDIKTLPIKQKQKERAINKLELISKLEIIKDKRMQTYEINEKNLALMMENLLARGKIWTKRKIVKKLFFLDQERKKQYVNNLKVLSEAKFKTQNDQKKLYQEFWDKYEKEYLSEREVALIRYKDPKRYAFLYNYYKKDPNNNLLKDFKPDPEKFEIYKNLTYKKK